MVGKIILSFLVSFLVAFYFIPHLIRIAQRKDLTDKPSVIKLHLSPKPTLGGIAIFLGFIISLLLFTNFCTCNHLQYLLLAAIILLIFNAKDDIIGLSPSKKLISQVLVSFILVFLGNLKIESFYGIFGIYNLPYLVSIFFTMLTIIIIINATNFIDGINGLASLLGIIALAYYGIFFILLSDYQHFIISFSFMGALLAFLLFNFPNGKIFMGDSGSNLLGLVLSILAIEFIKLPKNSILPIHTRPLLAMIPIFLILYDFLRVVIVRIVNKKSPLIGDKYHIHHILINKLNLSHKAATLILSLFQLILIFVGLSIAKTSNYIIGFTLLLICIFFTVIIFLIKKEKN